MAAFPIEKLPLNNFLFSGEEKRLIDQINADPNAFIPHLERLNEYYAGKELTDAIKRVKELSAASAKSHDWSSSDPSSYAASSSFSSPGYPSTASTPAYPSAASTPAYPSTASTPSFSSFSSPGYPSTASTPSFSSFSSPAFVPKSASMFGSPAASTNPFMFSPTRSAYVPDVSDPSSYSSVSSPAYVPGSAAYVPPVASVPRSGASVAPPGVPDISWINDYEPDFYDNLPAGSKKILIDELKISSPWLFQYPIVIPKSRDDNHIWSAETFILTDTIYKNRDTADISSLLFDINVIFNAADNPSVRKMLVRLSKLLTERIKREPKTAKLTVVNKFPPFDTFLLSKGEKFICIKDKGDNDAKMMSAIYDYADLIGLTPIISAIPRPLNALIKIWQTGSKQINDNYERSRQFHELTNRLPPLTEPVTLYRAYKQGIMPEPDSSDKNINFQNGIRSYSISLRFCQYFSTTGAANSDLLYSRVDVMPGVHVVPMFEYDTEEFDFPTEFEIALLSDARLHCLPNDIDERSPTPAPDLDFSGLRYKAGQKNPVIKFWFIVSNPNTAVDYTPYRSKQVRITGGGIKKLTDKDKYVVHGNMSIHEKMDKIMSLHKRKTKRRRGKTRKYKAWKL